MELVMDERYELQGIDFLKRIARELRKHESVFLDVAKFGLQFDGSERCLQLADRGISSFCLVFNGFPQVLPVPIQQGLEVVCPAQ